MTPIVDRSRLRGGLDGAIAQLGERVVRNDEVGGSIPPGSTSLRRLRLRSRQPAVWRSLPRRSPNGEDGLYPKMHLSVNREPSRPLASVCAIPRPQALVDKG